MYQFDHEHAWVLILEVLSRVSTLLRMGIPLFAQPFDTSRPHTRLQTGIVLKRRTPDDAHFYVAPKKPTTGRKKPKKPVDIEQVDARTKSSSPSSSNPPVTRHTSLGSVSASSKDPASASQVTFWHASPASDDQQEPRLPRSRATLPTPIPNLTKKSRGRRVPTQEFSRTPYGSKGYSVIHLSGRGLWQMLSPWRTSQASYSFHSHS
jgi:hypothetical protein